MLFDHVLERSSKDTNPKEVASPRISSPVSSPIRSTFGRFPSRSYPPWSLNSTASDYQSGLGDREYGSSQFLRRNSSLYDSVMPEVSPSSYACVHWNDPVCKRKDAVSADFRNAAQSLKVDRRQGFDLKCMRTYLFDVAAGVRARGDGVEKIMPSGTFVILKHSA